MRSGKPFAISLVLIFAYCTLMTTTPPVTPPPDAGVSSVTALPGATQRPEPDADRLATEQARKSPQAQAIQSETTTPREATTTPGATIQAVAFDPASR